MAIKLIKLKSIMQTNFWLRIRQSVSEIWFLNLECFIFYGGFGYKNVTIFITENEERSEHGIGVFVCKFIKK